MKTYYAEVTIDYFDNTIDEENLDGNEPLETCITRSVLIKGKNDFVALKKVMQDSLDNFTKEGYDPCVHFISKFNIETFYETTEDARND